MVQSVCIKRELNEGTINAFLNDKVAYIKPVKEEDQISYAVYAADGSQLAIFPTRDAAFYTARQHDLEPLDVH